MAPKPLFSNKHGYGVNSRDDLFQRLLPGAAGDELRFIQPYSKATIFKRLREPSHRRLVGTIVAQKKRRTAFHRP